MQKLLFVFSFLFSSERFCEKIRINFVSFRSFSQQFLVSFTTRRHLLEFNHDLPIRCYSLLQFWFLTIFSVKQARSSIRSRFHRRYQTHSPSKSDCVRVSWIKCSRTEVSIAIIENTRLYEEIFWQVICDFDWNYSWVLNCDRFKQYGSVNFSLWDCTYSLSYEQSS